MLSDMKQVEHDTQADGAEPSSRAPSSVLLNLREVIAVMRMPIQGNSAALDQETFALRRIRAGEWLIRSGDRFQTLCVVRSGAFKTVRLDGFGGEQVVGFPIRSDLVGVDGFDSGRYATDVIALEDSVVVMMPFGRIARIAHALPDLETLLYRAVTRELVRDQRLMWVIGALGAEARVAAYLLNVSERLGALGYSRSMLMLRASRADIGSYLGLKIETVSRAISAFVAAGWIRAKVKQIEILDPAALGRVIKDERRVAPKGALQPKPVSQSIDRKLTVVNRAELWDGLRAAAVPARAPGH